MTHSFPFNGIFSFKSLLTYIQQKALDIIWEDLYNNMLYLSYCNLSLFKDEKGWNICTLNDNKIECFGFDKIKAVFQFVITVGAENIVFIDKNPIYLQYKKGNFNAVEMIDWDKYIDEDDIETKEY